MYSLIHKFSQDHFYCAKYLINKNVSLDDLLEDCTALMVALVKNSMDLAELIINKCNLSIVSAKQGTALHLACRINNSFAVKLILQKNHNSIGFKDKLSNTPLHVACKYGSTACVEELLLTGNLKILKFCSILFIFFTKERKLIMKIRLEIHLFIWP
jgi:ankyrin repeat protein